MKFKSGWMVLFLFAAPTFALEWTFYDSDSRRIASGDVWYLNENFISLSRVLPFSRKHCENESRPWEGIFFTFDFVACLEQNFSAIDWALHRKGISDHSISRCDTYADYNDIGRTLNDNFEEIARVLREHKVRERPPFSPEDPAAVCCEQLLSKVRIPPGITITSCTATRVGAGK